MRDLWFSVIVAGLLPVCFLRPWVGFLVWTWLSLMSPHSLLWGFGQDVRWSLFAGGATLAGLLFTRDRKSVPWNTQLVLMVVLLAYFTFTSLYAWMPDAAWEKWNLVAKVIVMVILATMVIYGRDRIRWLLTVIALSVGYYGIKGGIWVLLTGGVYSVQGPDAGFMTMNNGIGIGLRATHYDHILTRKPVVDWFEIISENYLVPGGRPLGTRPLGTRVERVIRVEPIITSSIRGGAASLKGRLRFRRADGRI